MNVVDAARAFGCHDIIELRGEPSPRHLDYLDLLKISGNGSTKVDAVAEFQSRPVLYIVACDQVGHSDSQKMLDLQCLLANRGEMAYLGVLGPGELNVHPINLDRSELAKSVPMTIKRESSTAPLFFQSLVSGVFTLKGQPGKADYVFKTINDLMTRSSDTLR